MGRITLTDYSTVTELIKYTQKYKHRIEVKRMGNDWVGIWWEVKIYERQKLRNDPRKHRGDETRTTSRTGRRKSVR